MTDLLIVVPVYNEASRIEETVRQINDTFEKEEMTFKLVLAVDPSPDRSEFVCDQISERFSNVIVMHNQRKYGRGHAVREAWLSLDAKFYSFIDADLSSDEKTLLRAYNEIKDMNCNIIIGSRYHKDSITKRPPLRKVVSFSYNKTLNFLFLENIADHQCGLKIIDRMTRDRILSRTRVDSWFWDTELLIIAEKLGFRILEIPVEWIENKYDHTSLKRLFKDVLIHGWGMILLYKRLRALNSKEFPGAPPIHDI